MSRSKGSLSASAQANPHKQHADPRHAALIAAGQDKRQHSIFGHGHGQARVAHRQRIEHAETADDSTGHDGESQQRTADGDGRGHPIAG